MKEKHSQTGQNFRRKSKETFLGEGGNEGKKGKQYPIVFGATLGFVFRDKFLEICRGPYVVSGIGPCKASTLIPVHLYN